MWIWALPPRREPARRVRPGARGPTRLLGHYHRRPRRPTAGAESVGRRAPRPTGTRSASTWHRESASTGWIDWSRNTWNGSTEGWWRRGRSPQQLTRCTAPSAPLSGRLSGAAMSVATSPHWPGRRGSRWRRSSHTRSRRSRRSSALLPSGPIGHAGQSPSRSDFARVRCSVCAGPMSILIAGCCACGSRDCDRSTVTGAAEPAALSRAGVRDGSWSTARTGTPSPEPAGGWSAYPRRSSNCSASTSCSS